MIVSSYTASCGAAVKFSDEGYKSAGEPEIALRRENMRSTAQRTAQESELKRIKQVRRNIPETT